MPEQPPQPESPLQRQLVEMAQNLASQLETTAKKATPGQVLDDCEAFLLDKGRQFLRDCLAATVQQEIDEAEKKGVPPGPVLADRLAGTRGPDRVSSSLAWGPSA